jgi:hypothetical protein
MKYRTVPYDNWHYDLPALAAQINQKHQNHLSGQPE